MYHYLVENSPSVVAMAVAWSAAGYGRLDLASPLPTTRAEEAVETGDVRAENATRLACVATTRTTSHHWVPAVIGAFRRGRFRVDA